ncbi:M20/M25/M40 family metallo-hydrolase [Streptomyces sp. M19]
MLRADMDALPVKEDTGLPYASTATATDRDGSERPVMHACGHDVHVACLVGFARLMAASDDGAWRGTVVALFQPSEENGDGARAMIEDGLTDRVPRPDVVLAQHVLPYPPVTSAPAPGPSCRPPTACASRCTAGAPTARPAGRRRPGGHGGHVRRAPPDGDLPRTGGHHPAVLTVGGIQAGSGPNIIPDRAVLQLNVRTYDTAVRRQVLAAVERIVRAEATASGAPAEPEFEHLTSFPPTVNDPAATETVARAFAARFGDAAHTAELQTASEDMSEIPAPSAPLHLLGHRRHRPRPLRRRPGERHDRPGRRGQPQSRLRPRAAAHPRHRRQGPHRRRPRLARP